MMISIARHIIPAAYDVLPAAMAHTNATAMLLAIGWQESRFVHRRQVRGPAKGFPQFEAGGGVRGVQTHRASKAALARALTELRYDPTMDAATLHKILEHNDVVAMVCARLLLWTLPDRLPTRREPDFGWRQYIAAWRPGKPHPDTWPLAWSAAWETLDALEGLES